MLVKNVTLSRMNTIVLYYSQGYNHCNHSGLIAPPCPAMLRALHGFRFPKDRLILSSSGPAVIEEMTQFLEGITAEAKSGTRRCSAGENILAAPTSAESERETTHQRPFVGRNDREWPHTQARTALLIYCPGNNHPTVYSLRQIQYLCPEARSNLLSAFSVPVVVNFSN